MRGDEAYDVFLSYSRADGAAAETLRSRLKQAGLSAFLDRYGLPAGQPWQPWLEQHIGSCRALVVLVGPSGVGEWQHREIELGLDRQATAKKTGASFPVIPVLLPGLATDDVPVGRFLGLNTWVDLRRGLDEPESLQRLIAGAQAQAIDAAAAEKLLAGLTPYRGLLPFREQDAGLFFGRERFVKDLVQKVGQRAATNVVAVVGRSGSGKSSIVFAGLFSALRRERGFSGQPVWKIVDLRPHAEPLNELALAFDPPKAEPDSMEWTAALNAKAQLFRDRAVTLAQLIRRRLQSETGSTRLLLYVDQWEELYTQATPREIKSDDDRRRAADAKLFIDLVLEAAAKSPCTLVLSVRSDFYPDLQNHDGLRVAVQESQVSLGTMNEAELRAVIDGPSKALGATVDSELTKKLIRDIGLDPASGRGDEYDIGKLPLLEYALEQAWEKRTGPWIGTAQYSGLEQALEERANALYGKLSPKEQAAAKRLFVSLVTPGEGREDTRARIDMPDDDAMQRVIQAFAGGEARLVVTDEAGGRRWVEISHEALIRHWEKLRAWVEENRENLRIRDYLKANWAEWLKHDRDPGLLDLPELHLAAARKLRDEPGDVLIGEVGEYINAALERRRQRQEEEQREQEAEQRRELERANERAEAARRVAEERAKAEENERRLRQEAEAQKAAALLNESAALAALSNVSRPTSPARAAKLALASWPRSRADSRPKLDVAIDALSAALTQLRERKVLRGHDGAIWTAAFSPDGARVVTASADKTARIWDAKTGALIAILRGHDGRVLSAAFSREGARVVTASGDQTARLWDAKTGDEIAVLRGHAGEVLSAAFSPDGARVVTASLDKTARLWDAKTGDEIAILRGHDDPVRSVAFSPRGARVVTPGGVTARLWDAKTGDEIAVLRGHDDTVRSAAFSPDGGRVVTASDDRTARVWATEPRKRWFEWGRNAIAVLQGHDGWIQSAAFSPEGARVVTVSNDKTARIWDAATGKAIVVMRGHDGWGHSAAFSPDGARVVTTGDETARIWDSATGQAIAVLRGHDGWVRSAAFSPDGARVVTASNDGTARLWDAATNAAIAVLRGHDEVVWSATFSPDGARIVTGSWDKTARLWDAGTGASVAVLRGHDDVVRSAAFSPDGALVITTSLDKAARLWDSRTGEAIAALSDHDGAIWRAAFSPDGARVVTISGKRARVWDATTRKAIAVLGGDGEDVRSAAFSPAGALVVTVSGVTARVWDAATGEPIAVLTHDGAVHRAAFSPDGARIVTASEDKTARVWDAATGNAIAVMSGHDGPVHSASFSPDGARVVTSVWPGGTMLMWDAATGQTIAVLRGHDGVVHDAAFSPDGARIVSASEDKTARIWDAKTGGLIAILRGHDGRVLSAAFSRDGARVVTASEDKTARIWDVSAIPNGDLFQIACAWLPDHDLTGVARDYGLTNLDPICEGDAPLPDRVPQ